LIKTNEQSINFAVREFICNKNIVRARKIVQLILHVLLFLSLYIEVIRFIFVWRRKKKKR